MKALSQDHILLSTFAIQLNEKKQEMDVEFTVPPFLSELIISINCQSGTSRLAFQLNDPIRNRGFFVPWIPEQWDRDMTIQLSDQLATRGLEKGPIPAGIWKLHVSGIPFRDETSCEVTILGVPQDVSAYTWFPGDLHSHTNHTDGKYSLQELIEQAKGNGLEFLCLTDHNTMSAFHEMDDIEHDSFLLMKGLEITNTRGHANIFGLKAPIDWRVDGEQRTFSDVAIEAHLQGALFSINHPYAGVLGWDDWDMDLRLVDCIEIWNNPGDEQSPEGSELSLKKWDELLNEGFMPVGIGGSDSVHYFSYRHEPGYPTTFLFAEENTELHLLKALKERKAVTSLDAFIHCELKMKQDTYYIGDIVQIGEETTVQVTAVSAFVNPQRVQWIKNGDVFFETEILMNEELIQTIPVESGDWIRIQIRGEAGELLAFANPFFIR